MATSPRATGSALPVRGRVAAGAALACAALLLTACGSTVQQAAVLGGDGLQAPAAAAADGTEGTTTTASSTTAAPAGSNGASVSVPRPGAVAPGTTGTTRAGTGPAGTTPATTSAAPRATAALPPTGRGYDRSKIYLGYTTQNDFNTVASSAGYNSINAGDQVADVNAVLAAINKEGGLFGRQLVGIDRDNSSAEVTNDPNGTSASNCAYFTTDRRVVAVLNLESALDTPAFRSCMAAHQLPAMSLSIQPVTTSVLAGLHGYLIPLLVPTYDRLAPVLVARLKAQGYFTGWNTQAGTPSTTAPVRTGLLVTADQQGSAVAKIMKAELGTVGQAPTVFQYAASGSNQQSDFQSAILQFRSAGVTHVLADSANVATFMIAAQSQGYRPRYGISSYNAPQPFLEGLAPAAQLVGSMGVGSSPALDVDRAEDPGPTPGSAWCTKALADGGQTFTQYRFAQAVAFALCDGLRAVVAAAKASGSLSGPALVSGIATAGPTFPTSFAFRSGFSSSNAALPGAARDLAYDKACSCFRYRGGNVPL